MNEQEFTIETGALTDVPIYESHTRGKNWMASIDIDPSAPGGLKRAFFPTAKGEYYYLIDRLTLHDAIEFGADYTSGGGKRTAKRWYGVTTFVSDTVVRMVQFPTGREAVLRAREMAAEAEAAKAAKAAPPAPAGSPGNRAREIEQEIEQLRQEIENRRGRMAELMEEQIRLQEGQ